MKKIDYLFFILAFLLFTFIVVKTITSIQGCAEDPLAYAIESYMEEYDLSFVQITIKGLLEEGMFQAEGSTWNETIVSRNIRGRIDGWFFRP